MVRLIPEKSEKHMCIIYAHGNSSDLSDSIKFIDRMAQKFRAEFVVFDYSGYGESNISNTG